MADITSWEGNILQVSIPMMPPLRRVNSYVLPDKTGKLTIIDPGPRTLESEKAWEGVLQELGISWSRVRNIVVTHHHPDHYGLAGWMQTRCGCTVWMSERSHVEARLMWGEGAGMDEALPVFFARHGMPERWTSQIREHLDSFLPQVSPQPEVSFIDVNVPFHMGDREWLPLETGGHAPGHLSFYHKDSGQMLCGDAVLPLISPNVSLLPGSDPQPLLTFMEDLRKLLHYSVSLAFPGHREPFSGFTARIEALLRHHEERLETVEALLSEGPLTGYELCEVLFRGRVDGIHQLRFAMSETLAHAAELVRRGHVKELESGGIIRYHNLD
ncbi:MBL fold metallo-hydrolase [Paenibacillus sp. BR2-3]